MLCLHLPKDGQHPVAAGHRGFMSGAGRIPLQEMACICLRLAGKPPHRITDSWPKPCPPVPGGRCWVPGAGVYVCVCENE